MSKFATAFNEHRDNPHAQRKIRRRHKIRKRDPDLEELSKSELREITGAFYHGEELHDKAQAELDKRNDRCKLCGGVK